MSKIYVVSDFKGHVAEIDEATYCRLAGEAALMLQKGPVDKILELLEVREETSPHFRDGY